ncbi:MAG: efflux RND transporter permease subunit [Rhodobacteraceae bacterium]|nr:efflux RND transporter permease subunit [Paracoccaceae bacterium]
MVGYFVRHPVAANLLMLVLAVLGFSVITGIERETFPDYASDSVRITVTYPGASAHDVDDEICAPLEDAVSIVQRLSDFECLSVDSRAQATAELAEGGDLIQFFNDVFSAVSGINEFPGAAQQPTVQVASQTGLVALISVSGITGREGLLTYSEDLAGRIRALDGVSDATVTGIADREFQITFDQAALQRFGLSSSDVVNAVEARSLRQPLGAIELGEISVTLRYSGASRSQSELEDLIILEDDIGGLVRLRDIGQVALVDSDENLQSFIDGQRTAILQITKSAEADIIRVSAAVETVLAAERARYRDPFTLTVINNVSDIVDEQIDLIMGNIVLGLALVFGTMWLFFSLREALWISAALPVSFLGSLYLMSLFGITINMITLVALLMAIGLIMDDSIVISENISKWRTRVGPVEAATKGTLEVLPGVLSSFLTTACVFGPLMFLSGDMGQTLQFIPMVLLLTLAVSLVEGFFILPHHLSHVGHVDPKEHDNRASARAMEWVKERAVLPVATWLTSWRYLTFGTVLAALVLAIGLVTSGQVKVIGFPSSEGDTIIARIALTSGIERDRTEETVARILNGLDQVDARFTPQTEGGQPLVQRVLVQFATNSDVLDNGSHTATITVDLLESAQRNVAGDDVLVAWRAAAGPLPDVMQSSFAQSATGPGGLDLDVEVLGRDLDVVEDAASDLLTRLLAREDVTEAYQDFYGGRQEVQLALTEYGYSVGLTPQALARQLRDAFEGAETDSFRAGSSTMTVRVQLADTVQDLTELERFPVSLGAGAQTSLSTVADVTLTNSYPTITRANGMALARVRGSIDRNVTTSTAISDVVTQEIGPEIMHLYPGVEIGIGGATQDQQKTMSSMISALGLGLMGVYFVLAFQFRSYALPLAVMISIPFALIGTILGHWAMGLDLSMPSFIGFASLAGIVVNNAILFLTFFQSHLQGDDYVNASLNAVRDRFRPIFLSTSTTFMGLVPILFDTSPQVQTLVPLVVAVAFGLLASMVLVVLILPSVLSIYFDIFSVRNWIGRFEAQGTEMEGTARS